MGITSWALGDQNYKTLQDLEAEYQEKYPGMDTSGGVFSDARHAAASSLMSDRLGGGTTGDVLSNIGGFAREVPTFTSEVMGLTPFGQSWEDVKANAQAFSYPSNTAAADIYADVFSKYNANKGIPATNTGYQYGAAQAEDLTNLERDFPGMSTGDIIDSMNNRQARNRYSGMGQMGPVKSDMIGNTISEELIDENRIPGRVQESVPNYQNWFERMMSGAQDKLGGAWGKTKDLGSRFKEKAGPVFGLASMFANATNPLNPKSFNYNPGLKGQLDFMDKEMGGWSTTNPNSGLMQYGADTPLAGQNVFSGFGSNDPIAQLEKTLARRQKTYDNLENQWGNTLTAEELEAKKTNYFNKFINPTTNWLGKITEDQKVRIDKKNKALAIKEAEREARREDARNTAKIEAYTGQKMSDYRASRPRSERGFTGHGKSGMGRDPSDKMARGGRVGYGNGGLATLFTRRG